MKGLSWILGNEVVQAKYALGGICRPWFRNFNFYGIM